MVFSSSCFLQSRFRSLPKVVVFFVFCFVHTLSSLSLSVSQKISFCFLPHSERRDNNNNSPSSPPATAQIQDGIKKGGSLFAPPFFLFVFWLLLQHLWKHTRIGRRPFCMEQSVFGFLFFRVSVKTKVRSRPRKSQSGALQGVRGLQRKRERERERERERARERGRENERDGGSTREHASSLADKNSAQIEWTAAHRLHSGVVVGVVVVVGTLLLLFVCFFFRGNMRWLLLGGKRSGGRVRFRSRLALVRGSPKREEGEGEGGGK